MTRMSTYRIRLELSYARADSNLLRSALDKLLCLAHAAHIRQRADSLVGIPDVTNSNVHPITWSLAALQESKPPCHGR